MPGFNLIIYKTERPRDSRIPTAGTIYTDDSIAISKNLPYSYYPVNHWETDNYIFITEGYFFEWKDWKRKIEQFADKLFKSDNRAEPTKQYFGEVDGEFIGAIYNKSQQTTIVFNDVLARFPLYISESEHYVVISRNIGFISSLIALSINRQAALETLTTRFSFGIKTLYKEIERIPGGMIVEISNRAVKKQKYHEFNYEEMVAADFNINNELPEIESLFKEAVINRAGLGDLDIISLSGGLDSRAVAAVLAETGLHHRLVSFLDKQGSALNDIKYASQVADSLKMPLEIIELPDPSFNDFDLFFRMKYGLNGLDMTFLLYFLRYLTSLSKQPVLFTGDGGDRIFPSLMPPASVRSEPAAANYIINTYARMKPGIAAEILGQNKSTLRDEILSMLNTYPEKDWRYKYVHFCMEDVLTNLQFEGEDRNRCVLPSLTPFYHIRLFKKLMSVPHKLKKDHELYRRFLLRLSPQLSHIPNANWGFNLLQRRKIQWAYFKQGLKKTSLGKKLKLIVQKDYNCTHQQNTPEYFIFQHLVYNENLEMNVDVEYIKKLKHFSQEDLFRVMTLNKAINYFPLNFAGGDGKDVI